MDSLTLFFNLVTRGRKERKNEQSKWHFNGRRERRREKEKERERGRERKRETCEGVVERMNHANILLT